MIWALALWIRRRRVRWLRAKALEFEFQSYGTPAWRVREGRRLAAQMRAHAAALERSWR